MKTILILLGAEAATCAVALAVRDNISTKVVTFTIMLTLAVMFAAASTRRKK